MLLYIKFPSPLRPLQKAIRESRLVLSEPDLQKLRQVAFNYSQTCAMLRHAMGNLGGPHKLALRALRYGGLEFIRRLILSYILEIAEGEGETSMHHGLLACTSRLACSIAWGCLTLHPIG